MADKNFYSADQRSLILSRMTDDQIKTLFEYKRFLWKSYNLTLQYREANDWIFNGIETDPFYQRGSLYKRTNYLKCDICGYHPIKDRYILKSMSTGKVIGMGNSCFKDQVKISSQVRQEINEKRNKIDIYCDGIIRLFQQGKEFPIETYDQAIKNPKFSENENSIFFNRIKSFKKVNLPLSSRDEALLRRFARQANDEINKSKLSKKRINRIDNVNFDKFTDKQLESLNTYVEYRFYHEQAVLEEIFSNSYWRYEDVVAKQITRDNKSVEKCICGDECDYLVNLTNKYNQSNVLISPYHLQQHSIINSSREYKKAIEPFELISNEVYQIIFDYLDGKEFPNKEFDEALNAGFFQPDDKADMLDCCEVLQNAKLPLPKSILQKLNSFNEHQKNLALDGKLLTLINSYQTLTSLIQINMPGSKLIDELKVVASKYAANKTGIKLPPVGEDQVESLKSYDEKVQQIQFRKIELFVFYSGIKSRLNQSKLPMAKAIVEGCVDKKTQLRVSDNDIAALQKYVGKNI
ncbi:MAG: hypothetical protein ACI4UB_07490 [Limosilactobacillus sp.]